MKKFLLLIIFLFLASAFLNAQGGSTLRAKCPNSTRYFSLILQADGNINATPCEGKNFQINGENVIVNPTPTPTPTPTANANYYLSCLQLTGHVNFGFYNQLDKPYYQGMTFFVARPKQANWVYYADSGGFGGNHVQLIGFNSGATKFGVTGNANIGGTTLTTVQSSQKFYLNTWHFFAFIFDGANLNYVVDGVTEASTPVNNYFRLVNGIGDSVKFVCGSDHNKGDMDIAYIGAFENNLPVATGLLKPFRPPTYPTTTWFYGNAYYNVSFLADFTKPSNMIADISEGLSNGIPQIESQTITLSGAVTAGEIKSVITANGLPNSPVTITTNIANNATESEIATALLNAYKANSTIDGFFYPVRTNATVQLIHRLPQFQDTTSNFTVENVTSGGINNDLISTDTQIGYAGKFVKHSGILEGATTATGAYNDSQQPNPSNADKPQFVQGDFTKPLPVTKPTPTGTARIIDKFDNRISVPFWDNTISLGSTTGGTLGVKAWQGAPNSYGVTSAGEVFCNGEGTCGLTWVENEAQNATVEITKDTVLNATVRFIDDCNKVTVQSQGTALYINKSVACVNTGIFADTVIGASPNDISIVTLNDNIKVYFDGILKADVNGIADVTGTKFGFQLSSNDLSRVSSFVVR